MINIQLTPWFSVYSLHSRHCHWKAFTNSLQLRNPVMHNNKFITLRTYSHCTRNPVWTTSVFFKFIVILPPLSNVLTLKLTIESESHSRMDQQQCLIVFMIMMGIHFHELLLILMCHKVSINCCAYVIKEINNFHTLGNIDNYTCTALLCINI